MRALQMARRFDDLGSYLRLTLHTLETVNVRPRDNTTVILEADVISGAMTMYTLQQGKLYDGDLPEAELIRDVEPQERFFRVEILDD